MNLVTAVILFVPMDSVGTTWIPWAMTSATLACTALTWWGYADEAPRFAYDVAHGSVGVAGRKRVGVEADDDEDRGLLAVGAIQ
jgi:hypothetical protein